LLIANVIICVTTASMNYVKVAEYCKSSFSGPSFGKGGEHYRKVL